MIRTAILSIALLLSLTMEAVGYPSQRQLLNDGWLFRYGDADASGEWCGVQLPHDFQIAQPWVAPTADERADNSDAGANIKSRLSARGFKEMGKGCYKRSLFIPQEMKGRRVLLDFEGLLYTGDVFLNGQRIGGTDYGYVGFEIDITDKVSYGADNTLMVVADTGDPKNSRWYTGGGLFRNVWLRSTPSDIYFARHPLYITTADNKVLNICAAVSRKVKVDSLTFSVEVTDGDNKRVLDRTFTMRNHRQQRTEEFQLPAIDLPTDIKLWSCEHPNLYTAKVKVMAADGTVADSTASTFGVRTIEFSSEHGFLLNGQKVLLKGYANHHSLGALGAAAYPDAIEKRILLMKSFGINHIRTSHNPYSEAFLDLCDKHGIIVVDELYDKWLTQFTGGKGDFSSLWQHDVPEWIMRDRNHPSVVLWSFGNELQQYSTLPFNDWGVTQYNLMRTLQQRYDDSRLSTVAMHPRYRSLDTDSLPADLARVTDIQSYNYRYMYFPGDARRFPYMRFYQSEASMSAMGPNFYEMDLDKVIGLAYWGAIDYLGESQGWPAKGWAQGAFDMSLQPKPKAYLMKSMFSSEPVVHIGIIEDKKDMMWNGIQTGTEDMTDHWNRSADASVNVMVYSNAEEVELLLNGHSLGRKQNDIGNPKVRNQIAFSDVGYKPGRLEAVAYNSGKVVARHRIETTGNPTALKAVVEDNGTELLHVRIHAVDSHGRTVPFANNDVTISVTGGTLLAMDNGDIRSDEPHVTNHRTLHNGTLLAIIRKNGNPITLTATADGLKTTTKTITKTKITI